MNATARARMFKDLVNQAAKFKFMDVVEYKGKPYYVTDVNFKMIPNKFIHGLPENGDWNLYKIDYTLQPTRDNPNKSKRYNVLQKELVIYKENPE